MYLINLPYLPCRKRQQKIINPKNKTISKMERIIFISSLLCRTFSTYGLVKTLQAFRTKPITTIPIRMLLFNHIDNMEFGVMNIFYEIPLNLLITN